MRGQNYKRRTTRKHGQRLLLSGLLAASGHLAQAETPVAMVPLPLTPAANTPAGVRTNPFCQPVVVEAVAPPASSSNAIQLTSGGELRRRDDGSGRDEALRPAIQNSVFEAPGGVRPNPLAFHLPTGGDLAPSVDLAGVRALSSGKTRKAGVSFSLSDDDTVAVESTAEPIQWSLDDHSELAGEDRPDGASRFGSGRAAATPTKRPAAAWNGSSEPASTIGLPAPVNLRALEPKQFAAGRIVPVPDMASESSYDQTAPDTRPNTAQPLGGLQASPDDDRLVNGARPRVEVGRPPVAIDRMASMSIVPGKARVLTVDPEDLEPAAPAIALPTPAATGLPLPTVADVNPETSRDAGHGVEADHVVQRATKPAEQPPAAMVPAAPTSGKKLQSVVVASDPPAATVANGKSLAAPAGPDAQAQRSPSPAIDTEPDPSEPVQAVFQLKPTEVRSIKLDGTVTRIQSDNLAVCAVLQSTSGQMQLIATGVGKTRLSVHTVDPEGVEKRQRLEVVVGQSQAAMVDSPESIAMTLTQTAQSAFPGSNVVVHAESGKLIVTGSCPDEETAKRMLRMIRAACSIPVVDRVKAL